MHQLHDAFISNQNERTVETVKRLLDQGADILGKDGLEQTALHLAVTNQSNYTPDIIKELCKYGSDVDETDKKGKTPLHLAVANISEWTPAIVNAFTMAEDLHYCRMGETYELYIDSVEHMLLK